MFYKEVLLFEMNPKQAKGLVPAKNEDKIGVANEKTKQFYILDTAHFNVWLLCNGERDEEVIGEEFINFLKENLEGADAKFDKKQIIKDVKNIIKKLKKYGLLE
ncbi:hypothetical protein COS64_02495 [archaeon CG06_land_8_20_14_3_00_37_11]|nr:MAG: hypothetical protein COS64_02495 [archaeon CG06_land_8_20_14_3_00_37_11]